jgi:hypothetical protein
MIFLKLSILSMHFNKTGKSLFVFFFYFILINTEMQGQNFTTKKSADGIEIFENGKKILFYQVSPKSVNGKYERAGYVHPLYDLDEKILTEDMPADHPYHRGIFWAWHQLIWNNKNIGDGWISENISYKPVMADVKEKRNSLVLKSEMIWNARVDSNMVSLVREKTRITVFKSTSQYRIIDFDIKLSALVDNLKIGGSDDAKGYGGFCLRLKLPKDISFVSGNKEVIPQETAVPAGPWMDISGSFEGESSPKTGVAVFGYPPGNDNNNPWILRSVTSMQNIPYPGKTAIPLSKKGLILKYRIVVHNSDIKTQDIEKLYQDYITGK